MIYLFVNEKLWQDDDTTTITLLILDPQNDFHEGHGKIGDKGYIPEGSLAVKGF